MRSLVRSAQRFGDWMACIQRQSSACGWRSIAHDGEPTDPSSVSISPTHGIPAIPSLRLMPKRGMMTSSLAIATTARPAANTKGESLRKRESARPRAAMHRAVRGRMAAKAEPPAREQWHISPAGDEAAGATCPRDKAGNLTRALCIQTAGVPNKRCHLGSRVKIAWDRRYFRSHVEPVQQHFQLSTCVTGYDVFATIYRSRNEQGRMGIVSITLSLRATERRLTVLSFGASDQDLVAIRL
jgi:hypothetical protein